MDDELISEIYNVKQVFQDYLDLGYNASEACLACETVLLESEILI